MLVFILANLPLPVIFYLNLLVTYKFLRVRQLSHHRSITRPERLIIGWWLGNVAWIFILTPMLYEHRIFVQNPWWLISYACAASLSISGLLLMNSGLSQELRTLQQPRHRSRVRRKTG